MFSPDFSISDCNYNMKDFTTNDSLLVYGGTFDPPHLAHIKIPFLASEKLNTNKVIFVPTGTPPHKTTVSSNLNRLKMLELSLENSPPHIIDHFELERTEMTYAYQTLEYLKEKYNSQIFFIIGTDQAKTFFDTWKNTDRILNAATPVAMIRPPCTKNDLNNWKFPIIDIDQYQISSTELRNLLKYKKYNNKLVTDWIVPKTLDYIRKHKLYEREHDK